MKESSMQEFAGMLTVKLVSGIHKSRSKTVIAIMSISYQIHQYAMDVTVLLNITATNKLIINFTSITFYANHHNYSITLTFRI